MNSNTAYNHCERFKRIVNSVWSGALIFNQPHAEILAEIDSKVFKDSAWLKCPAWVRQTVGDLAGNWLHYVHLERVVWMFPLPDGRPVSWELLPDELKRSDIKGNHYWIKDRTPHVGTMANPGHYKVGDSIVRTFEVTDKVF